MFLLSHTMYCAQCLPLAVSTPIFVMPQLKLIILYACYVVFHDVSSKSIFFQIRPCGVYSNKDNGASSTAQINLTNYLVHCTVQTNPIPCSKQPQV